MISGPSTNALTIDKRLVHKYLDENVLLASLEQLPNDRTADGIGRFFCKIYIHSTHPFFFEHPRNHIPGLYLIEAGRQMGIAISHQFYDVPFDTEFMLLAVGVQFTGIANLFDPVTVVCTMSGHVYKRGQLVSMHEAAIFSQNSKEVCRMDGSLVTMSKDLLKWLERQATDGSTGLSR